MIWELAGRLLCALGRHRLPENFRLATPEDVHAPHVWSFACQRLHCRVFCACMPQDHLEEAWERWRRQAYRRRLP